MSNGPINYNSEDCKPVKVTVIIPTYRREESLKKAIQSILSQTYSNIEIIVIDDNADQVWNTKVENVINECISKDNFEIVYIQNEKNEGSSRTRNKGIEKATGFFVTFLDDDDLYLNNKILNQVNHMIETDSDFSVTDLWLYNEKDTLIEKRIRNYLKDSKREDLIKKHLMFHITGTDTMMFKKEYLLEIGMFENIDVGDEFHLMLKAIKMKGKFSYLQGCDVKAYVHSDINGLSSGDSKIKGENDLYKYKKEYFNIFTNSEKRYIKMRHYMVIAYAEFRRKRYFATVTNVSRAFLSSPKELVKLVLNRY